MESTILILTGIVLFVDTLFDKWNFWHWFETFGQNQTWSIWLYNLTQCRFCCLFWMTNLIWLWAAIFGFLQWTTFPVVFIVAGLTTLKHKP